MGKAYTVLFGDREKTAKRKGTRRNRSSTTPVNAPGEASTTPVEEPGEASTTRVEELSEASTTPVVEPGEASTTPVEEPGEAVTTLVEAPPGEASTTLDEAPPGEASMTRRAMRRSRFAAGWRRKIRHRKQMRKTWLEEDEKEKKSSSVLAWESMGSVLMDRARDEIRSQALSDRVLAIYARGRFAAIRGYEAWLQELQPYHICFGCSKADVYGSPDPWTGLFWCTKCWYFYFSSMRSQHEVDREYSWI